MALHRLKQLRQLLVVDTTQLAADAVDNTILDLAGNYAFTGTITGAGSEGFIHLETQETTTAVASMKFSDVFNTTYDRYYIVGRALPATDGVSLQFSFMDSSESNLSTSISYRYTLNGNTNTNDTKGVLTSTIGAVHGIECGVMWTMDIWLPHVGTTDYMTMGKSIAHRVNTGNNSQRDEASIFFRYDQDTTQPQGMNFYMISGNFSKATISVFAVSGA